MKDQKRKEKKKRNLGHGMLLECEKKPRHHGLVQNQGGGWKRGEGQWKTSGLSVIWVSAIRRPPRMDQPCQHAHVLASSLWLFIKHLFFDRLAFL